MDTQINFKQALMAGAMASLTAVVINAVLFLIFQAAGVIVDTIFIQPNQPLTIIPIIISSILPTMVASVVFFLIEKFTNNGFKIFRLVSIILLILSFMNPFMGIPEVTVGYAMVLNLMHVVVAGSILYFVNKRVQSESK